MKSFALLYLKSVSVATMALIPAGIGCVLYSILHSVVVGPQAQTDLVLAAGVFFLIMLYTFGIGLVLICLVGAPAYALLVLIGKDRWPYVLALGIAPGLAFLYFDQDLGPFVIGCGVFVAAWTHYDFLQQIRSERVAVV